MKRLNILKVIDQYSWAWDFLDKEQKRFSRHNIIIERADLINSLDNIDIVYIHSPLISLKAKNELPIMAKNKNIFVIGGYAGDAEMLYSYVDALIAVSPQTYKFCIQNYKESVLFLPQSVDTDYFYPVEKGHSEFKVGWCASSHPVKRSYLLDKFDFPVLRQSDWGKEFFIKDLTQDKVRSFYHNIDVKILVSKTEGIPRVILESMACGLPVISTNVGSISMLLEKDYLINETDETMIVKSMNRLLHLLYENIELRKIVGKKNREYIEQNFSWKVNIDLWDDVFELIFERKISEAINATNNFIKPFKNLFT